MEIQARVAALAQAAPALADELALRGALIEILDHAEAGPVELRLPGDLARARLAAGTPLLDGLALPIPPASMHLFERLAVAILADPASRQPAEALLNAVRSHRLHPEQLIGEAIVSHADHLTALADGARVPAALVSTLADLASRPLLAELGRRLRPALALGGWTRGYCPVCGALPIFAERGTRSQSPERTGDADPADSAIRLRCGRCAAAWAWSLPRCPDCSTGSLTAPDALTSHGTTHWSLLACDACRAYLKLTDLPDLSAGARLADLLLADLESWHLDRQALSLGLARSSEPGRRLEHGEIPSEGVGEDLADD
jgi:FdhE protein